MLIAAGVLVHFSIESYPARPLRTRKGLAWMGFPRYAMRDWIGENGVQMEVSIQARAITTPGPP